MIELEPENIIDFLKSSGHLASDMEATAEMLAWGVSNIVMRIRPTDGNDLVVKQSREQLRTDAPWFSRLDRIWREVEIMQTLAPLLPLEAIPNVLFEDRENYVFGMEAVAADHLVWKAELLEGNVDLNIAVTAGEYLSAIHSKTCDNDELRQRWIDREVFDQLRIDPFYRRIADVHPELAESVRKTVEETFDTAVCVVHADFSPKNILVTPNRITLVDFETGHFGDPAFDLGFFLSHLLLKTILHATRRQEFIELSRTFWQKYQAGIEKARPVTINATKAFEPANLERRAISHLAGCMLARIDGKSTVDYLPQEQQRNFVRAFCRELFLSPPPRLHDVFNALECQLDKHESNRP